MAWAVFDFLATNISMSLENAILFVTVVGSLIFFAKDFKLGLVMLFLTSGCLFMAFYNLGWNYTGTVVVFFMSLVIMSLALLSASNKAASGGAFI